MIAWLFAVQHSQAFAPTSASRHLLTVHRKHQYRCKSVSCLLASAKNDINGEDQSLNGTTDTPILSAAQPSFDADSEYEGDLFSLCFLTDDEDDQYNCDASSPPYPSDRGGDSDVISNLVLRYIPVLMPMLAYSTYELTAQLFDSLVEFVSSNNWVAVDGGAYQSSIITPAINGLVVPSMALLFATLMSNTINTLRQRQMQIRTSLK